MAKNFAAIAYTDAVKALQEKHGSRNSYERMEKFNVVDGLSNNEIGFIENRDSFFMASISENNFPYIQHRGGPKGFLKVLDKNRIGFIDFSGNKQYITVGNMETNNNVALFLMDYPAKVRLKIFAKTEIVELKDNPELLATLDIDDYKFRAERMMIFHIEAFDWNCPQHITPRFTAEEIKIALKPQQEYVAQLEEENKRLTAKLKGAGL
ncbi:pyridoxamine 5'-phosphate oxidase family protein [Flavobacterium soyangense]|uniref:Pyridoxamine 5'-phosphate oxidase family protein n=1 Tax=Flavobacterium soyangense TaxID=2023265 RepID=A0A930UA75_9FLAO|nr:pyridoxamine 5'-phosphate oxidase family protein [Flavobacterium soyangense]MBF2709798.1 pyridoxamine 5'-phosphate oxidase family protein [Flavobacterium soyangense]